MRLSEANRYASLAQLIVQALKQRRMNRIQFARKMGIQPSSVTKWLSGSHNFTVDTLFRIEHVLGISLISGVLPQPTPTLPKYLYEGCKYELLHVAKLKIGEVWISCIVYRSLADGKSYVREWNDFMEKFAQM